MSINYLSVVSCASCGEMIRTQPDGTIVCACTTMRSCKHPEGMSDCHECTIADLEAENARLQKEVALVLAGLDCRNADGYIVPGEMRCGKGTQCAKHQRDRLQAQVEESEEKARKYDAWFEKGRCPACHFEEKHLASCPIKVLESESDRYKARWERCRDALEAWAEDIACPQCPQDETLGCDHCGSSGIDWPRFRAAIEEAKEK